MPLTLTDTRPVQPVACKICGSATELQGCVDLGRSCEVNRGTYLPLTGVPIFYQRCLTCGFLFTHAFDTWRLSDFASFIYNDGYAAADPDYGDGSRARANAALISNILGQIGQRRILDYGGGNGILAAALRAQEFDAQSWDPVVDLDTDPPAPASFGLVTAFEVFEHTPSPLETTRQALSFLLPGGLLLFSTVLMDELPRQSTDHWYIAPRNGHISLHSTASLQRMFTALGWNVRSLSANLHIAQR